LPFGFDEIGRISHPQFTGPSGQKSTAKSSDRFEILEFSNTLLESGHQVENERTMLW
jgi:hypothetical protein